MDNCKYRLNIDGHYEEFQSEQEMHTFIRENRKLLVSSLLTDKISFSKELDPQETAISVLNNMSDTVDFIPEGHTLTVAKGPYQGMELTPTTKFIYENKGEDGNNLVQGFNMRDWETNQRAQLTQEKGNDGTPKYDTAHIDDIISSIKNRWETQSYVGTSWHSIAQEFFKGAVTTPDDVFRITPGLQGNSFAAKQYLTQLQSLKESLLAKHGADSAFLTEVRMYDPKAKIGGIADLIVVDPTGRLHVYDYKTSSTPDSEWVKAKQLAIDYQLGFYRQILRRAGQDVASINYIPITLNDIDMDTRVITSFQMMPPKSTYIIDTSPVGRNIQNLLPYDFSSKVKEATTNAEVAHFLKEAFNYDITKSDTASKHTVEEVMGRLELTPRGNQYQLRDEMNNNSYLYFDATRGDAFVKKAVEGYIARLDNYTKYMPVRFYDFVSRAKMLVERNELVDYNDWSKTRNVDTANKVENLLGKYINDKSWTPLESSALNDLGIVGFENYLTNEVDFITITANNLNRPPELLRGKTLLGNFITDDKARQLPGVRYDLLNKDVELFKIYAFIKSNEGIFKTKKIGNLFAVNMYDNNVIPRVYTQTTEALERQWNTMMDNIPSTLDIKKRTWVPATIDFSQALTSYIGPLLENPGFRPAGVKALRIQYGRLLTANEQDEKVNALSRIQEVLDQSIGYNIQTAVQSRQDLAMAKLLTARAILQLTDTPTQVEPDMKKWSFLADENVNLSNPNRISHLAFQQMQTLVTNGINNTASLFNDYKRKDAIPMHEDLYKTKTNIMKVKVIGYNLDAFDNLFELDGAGNRTMRFRDPKLDPKLTPAERKYITKYMEVVASVRVPKIVDDATGGSRKSSEVDMQIYMASPEARNIPLMRASILTAFKGKDYKEFFNDYMRRVLNPQNIYSADEGSKRDLENQTKLINFFDIYDIHEDKRAEKLATSKPTDFESDLESVLDVYMLANSKQQELNKQLPVINALKTFVALNEHYFFNDSQNTMDAMKNYISTVAMGNVLLAGESKSLAVASKIGQDMTSIAMSALSPAAFVTRGLNSMFNSVVRTAANRYNMGAYGFKEFSQAMQVVVGSTLKNKVSYGNYILTDALNDTYRLNERGMREMSYKNQTTSGGLTNFKSEGMYWMNKIPSYMNRMALFIAQSIKDGTIEVDAIGNTTKNSATQMVNGQLVYNERLDKRFREYLSDPNRSDHLQSDSWKQARALYLGAKADLSQEPNGLKADGTLARAYSNKERNSLKEFADEVDGNYDPETKNQWSKTALGKIFMQFKGGWLTAKKNRWYTATTADSAQGRWTTEVVDGETKRVWEGKISEGIIQSLIAVANEIKTKRTPLVWDSLDPVRKQNMIFMFGDLLVFGLIGALVNAAGWLGDADSNPIAYQFGRSLTNASNDLFIGNTISTVTGKTNPVAMFSWGDSVIDNTWGLITNKKNAGAHLLNTVGAYRSIHSLVQ